MKQRLIRWWSQIRPRYRIWITVLLVACTISLPALGISFYRAVRAPSVSTHSGDKGGLPSVSAAESSRPVTVADQWAPWIQPSANTDAAVQDDHVLLLEPNGAIRVSAWIVRFDPANTDWRRSPGQTAVTALSTGDYANVRIYGSRLTFKLNIGQPFIAHSDPAFVYAIGSDGIVWDMSVQNALTIRYQDTTN